MKMTSKGQVTIPQDVRKKAGFQPGSDLEFVFVGRQVMVRKAKGAPRRELDFLKRLRGSGTAKKMTTDEIMALTRGE